MSKNDLLSTIDAEIARLMLQRRYELMAWPLLLP